MAKKTPVEIVCVIDRSGSMQSIASDAIGGFNAFLKEQKEVKGKANLTLILFDHDYTVVHAAKDIKDIEPLDGKTYVPRGNTAMNDAINRAIGDLEARSPDKAIICILTDGQENASKEVTGEQLKKKIEAAKARGWSFVFLAANQDAFASGAAMGFDKNTTFNFKATQAGTQAAYVSMSAVTRSYRGA